MSEKISVRQPRLLLKELSQDGVHLKESARLHPLSQPMELNARFMSTATLTLPESDPELVLHDLVELYTVNGSAGIFWVVGREPNYGKNRVYKLNHAIDILSASTCPGNPAGEETYNSTVTGFISEMLAEQKQKIGNTPFWQLGTCEDTGFWYKEISYDNVLEDLSELEKDHEDYHFTFDFSTFPWTLNFVRFSDDVLSEFRLTRNIDNVRVSLNDANLCTKLYLSVSTKATVTQNDQNAGEIETTEYLSFENAEGIAQWGVIERSQGIETDKEPDTQDFVQRYFRKHGAPELAITIDGEEIVRLTGDPLDEAALGGICRVAIPKYTVFFNERSLGVKYPDAQKTPLKISLSISNKRKDMAGSIVSANKTASRAAATASSALRAANNNSTKLKQLSYRFEDETGNLRSMIEMNAEHLRTQFENTKEQLTSKFEQTAEHFQWELDDAKRQLHSQMELTAEHLKTRFEDGLEGLHSEFELTAQQLRTDFTDAINEQSSHFELTAQHMQAQFNDDKNQLYSALEMTAEHLQAGFEDRLYGFKSEVELNAQHMQATFTDRLRQMESTFELSAQHMQASFTDKINGLESSFELNAAHLRTEFYNQVEGLQAEFEVNARALNYATTKADENGNILAKAGLYIGTDGNIAYNYNAVNGVGTQFQQHADAIGTVVGTYNGRYFIKAGEVVDSINAQTGQTIHKVDMDKITLKNNAIISCINNGPGSGETALTIDFNRLNLSSGSLIKVINGGGSNASTLKIDVGHLDVTGLATVGALNTEKARIDNLVSGVTKASILHASSLKGDQAEVTGLTVTDINQFTVAGDRIGKFKVRMDGIAAESTFLGTAAVNLAHSHSITTQEITSGTNAGKVKVTLGAAVETTSNDRIDFFDIAGTQTYINGVSAAWIAASNEVDMLGRKNGTGNYVSLKNQTGEISLDYGETYQIKTVWRTGANNPQSSIVRTISAPSTVSITGSWNATGLQYVGYENTYHMYNNGSEVGSKTIYLSTYGNDTIVAREDSYYGTVVAKIDSKYSDGESAGYNNGYSVGYSDGQKPENNFYSFAWNGTGISTRFRIHMNNEDTGLVGHLAYDGDYISVVGNDGYTYARLLRSP